MYVATHRRDTNIFSVLHMFILNTSRLLETFLLLCVVLHAVRLAMFVVFQAKIPKHLALESNVGRTG